ncbi:MAG: carbonic anhydrase family protein [Campylobacterales bacterium]|nr:carbonic anhydrase family protein [Campylobacterales bacterium]
MKKITLALSSALLLMATGCATSHTVHKAHWGYTGHEGPSNWGSLSDDYKMCSLGRNQSPINVTHSLDAKLAPITFSYTTAPTEILNNGHTVQVNIAAGSYIVVDGKKYELKQYHFHTPSENHIEGKSFPLEAHFVHAASDGELAVIGVMFEYGKANTTLAQLWEKMPMNADEKHELNNIAKNLMALIPTKTQYYRFNGSLTTPPCSEGVKWMVLGKMLKVSKAQIEKFAHALHGHNNRPIQATNARVIVK